MIQAAERQTAVHSRGSGGQIGNPEPRYLAIGRIVGAHGLRGELKVEILTDDPHRFHSLERLFIGPQSSEPLPWALEGWRLHKGRALLQVAGCHDRATAESMRGQLVQIPFDEAIPLEEGEYFEHHILGLEVWTKSGEHLGSVDEIIYTGANEVYVVRTAAEKSCEILIPAIKDVVIEVDLEIGRLLVELPDGLV